MTRPLLSLALVVVTTHGTLRGVETPDTKVTKSPNGQFEAVVNDATVRLRLTGSSRSILLSDAGIDNEYGVYWHPSGRYVAVNIHYGRFARGMEVYRISSSHGIPTVTTLKLPPVTTRVKDKLGVEAPKHNSLQARQWLASNRLLIDAYGDDYQAEVVVVIDKFGSIAIESISDNKQ